MKYHFERKLTYWIFFQRDNMRYRKKKLFTWAVYLLAVALCESFYEFMHQSKFEEGRKQTKILIFKHYLYIPETNIWFG